MRLTFVALIALPFPVAAQQATLDVMVVRRGVLSRFERCPLPVVPMQHLQLAELNHAISSLRSCVVEGECGASVKEHAPWMRCRFGWPQPSSRLRCRGQRTLRRSPAVRG